MESRRMPSVHVRSVVVESEGVGGVGEAAAALPGGGSNCGGGEPRARGGGCGGGEVRGAAGCCGVG
eukprot:3116490-Prymnesium_polylepis.1